MKLKENSKPEMGEVFAKVRMVNGLDEMLAHEGKLKSSEIRRVETDALVDSGAVRSVIPAAFASRIGLLGEPTQTVVYADGRKEKVPLAGPIRFIIEGRETFDDACVLGDQVLIGQTVLEKMDWLVDCTRRRLVPARPEGPLNNLK